ncbi:MAG: phosphonates-binding protein [Bdellovibrionales bacterium RIFCSPHIGHO2_01_FULL_40_29]|nr:MAG: phosphonates-binding protein [Bdellovibrionales bacterium RIFCSPHIGHO2_01_FULL_40_29]OFZ33968.1 MAG: phosphonates-binding protein [Bdellovibrionales bacterium RIFCSPHIGHO2_02_FULL_40_15]
MKKLVLSAIVASALVFVGCTKKTAELGTAENPIKLHFVPSVDAKVIEDNSAKFKEYLEKNTPYKYEVTIPQSFVAVVEAFGTKRADVAAINTFGYVLAHDKYQAEARLTVLRHGASTYQSQFIAKADSGIKTIEDLAGKKIAFVDAASTSGYLLPLKTLKDKKIEPKETMFAQKHDNVVSMVYQGQVDAGATFYSPASKDDKGVSQIEDARRLVKTQYPDVEQKVAIISLSEPIPNDPIIFRKEMPEEMKAKIIDTMMSFVGTPEGKDAFKAIYGVTDLKKATDADYESVRMMLKTLGKDASDFMKK